MRQRYYLKKTNSRTKNTEDWTAFKKLKNEVNPLIKIAKARYYKYKIGDSKTPRDTWKAINEVTGRSSNNKRVMKLKYNNPGYTKPSQIADAFNDHFVDVGPKLADVNFGSAN